MFASIVCGIRRPIHTLTHTRAHAPCTYRFVLIFILSRPNLTVCVGDHEKSTNAHSGSWHRPSWHVHASKRASAHNAKAWPAYGTSWQSASIKINGESKSMAEKRIWWTRELETVINNTIVKAAKLNAKKVHIAPFRCRRRNRCHCCCCRFFITIFRLLYSSEKQ